MSENGKGNPNKHTARKPTKQTPPTQVGRPSLGDGKLEQITVYVPQAVIDWYEAQSVALTQSTGYSVKRAEVARKAMEWYMEHAEALRTTGTALKEALAQPIEST